MSGAAPRPWMMGPKPSGGFNIYTGEYKLGRWKRVAEVEGEADARLIVAAPETARQRDELLAALEKMLHSYEQLMARGRVTQSTYLQGFVTNARVAIAKAKGQV